MQGEAAERDEKGQTARPCFVLQRSSVALEGDESTRRIAEVSSRRGEESTQLKGNAAQHQVHRATAAAEEEWGSITNNKTAASNWAMGHARSANERGVARERAGQQQARAPPHRASVP